MMRRLLLLLLLLSFGAWAQNWSGIIASNRASDWRGTGAAIPANRTAVCATLAAGSTTSQINTAITNCAAAHTADAGGIVQLAAGTYNNLTGINMASNVTLRGAGANLTILNFSNSANCFGGPYTGLICMKGSNYSNPQGPGLTGTITGGYTQGSTTITVASAANLAVGRLLMLDQNSDASDGGYTYVCATTGCTAEGGGSGWSRDGKQHVQVVRITSINGTNIGIDPPIYATDWRSGQAPGYWGDAVSLIQNAGVEDVQINPAAGFTNGGANVMFGQAHNCWARGIMAIKAGKGNITTFEATHITLRDSYLYTSTDWVSEHYGIQAQLVSSFLIENNIFQKITSGLVMNGGAMGTVFAYNYNLQNDFALGDWWPGIANHESSDDMALYEGNIGPGVREDMIHGTHNQITMFRNRFSGNDPTKTQTPRSGSTIQTDNISRMYNVIGNVLGTSGVSSGYTSGIYGLSAATTTTLMRWGNYDTVNNAVRWVNAEVPSGTAQYANPVPADHNLPASFYLSAKPAWWGNTVPWPPIGPDVTGGDIASVGGFAYQTPSMLCYVNGSKDVNAALTNFNANTCYAAGPVTYTLSVSKAGSGTVTGGSINCGATCSQSSIAPGTQITLAASPAAGYTFTSWSGGGCSGAGTCTVTVNADTVVTATFTQITYTLTVNKAGLGTVTGGSINCGVTCSQGSITPGTQVTLTASPSVGYTFTSWSGGGCAGSGTCTVTVNANTTVTATFTANQYTLTVSKLGSGSGTVTGGTISCGGICSQTANYGTVVTLSASPAVGSVFTGWAGAGCSGTGTCTVTLSTDLAVSAQFNLAVSGSVTVQGGVKIQGGVIVP